MSTAASNARLNVIKRFIRPPFLKIVWIVKEAGFRLVAGRLQFCNVIVF
jgi:hypothetical protein